MPSAIWVLYTFGNLFKWILHQSFSWFQAFQTNKKYHMTVHCSYTWQKQRSKNMLQASLNHQKHKASSLRLSFDLWDADQILTNNLRCRFMLDFITCVLLEWYRQAKLQITNWCVSLHWGSIHIINYWPSWGKRFKTDLSEAHNRKTLKPNTWMCTSYATTNKTPSLLSVYLSFSFQVATGISQRFWSKGKMYPLSLSVLCRESLPFCSGSYQLYTRNSSMLHVVPCALSNC